MTIIEWFDPNNIEHLRAFQQLNNTGVWPTGVAPTGIEFNHLWQVTLTAKLADAYLDLKLMVK